MKKLPRLKKLNSDDRNNLPIKHNLKFSYIFSFIIIILMIVASVSGILFSNIFYPSDELLFTFMSNDVVNLIIGLPVILISIFLTAQKKMIGLLFWPGALLFVAYNYLIYILAMPFNIAFFLHLILVTLSIYTLISLVASIDGEKIQPRLTGLVNERMSGGILVFLGILFLIQVVGVFITSIINQVSITPTELATHVSDFIISPALIIGGTLLWQRKKFGYISGLGLLFQSSMLFVGLIVFLIIQPLLTSTPFLTADILIVFVMGLICFVPFTLFVRGIVIEDKPE